MASTLRVERMWTLAEARNLITPLQAHLYPVGFHACLGGSVLNKGISQKDLDLYLLPTDNPTVTPNPAGLLTLLEGMWGPGIPIRPAPAPGQAVRFRIRTAPDGNPVAIPEPQVTPIAPPSEYPQTANSPYSHKLKFSWSDLRIDVFIIGPKPPEMNTLPMPEGSILPEGMAAPVDWGAPQAAQPDFLTAAAERAARTNRDNWRNFVTNMQTPFSVTGWGDGGGEGGQG